MGPLLREVTYLTPDTCMNPMVVAARGVLTFLPVASAIGHSCEMLLVHRYKRIGDIFSFIAYHFTLCLSSHSVDLLGFGPHPYIIAIDSSSIIFIGSLKRKRIFLSTI